MRGLKYNNASGFRTRKRVAPHWGAWIEIDCVGLFDFVMAVAPHWGAWIEITSVVTSTVFACVAPHWGAWIEITRHDGLRGKSGRTPLGCVD